jgi:hypothetical protein
MAAQGADFPRDIRSPLWVDNDSPACDEVHQVVIDSLLNRFPDPHLPHPRAAIPRRHAKRHRTKR